MSETKAHVDNFVAIPIATSTNSSPSTSPLKWGVAAAAAVHLGCIFLTGLTSAAPWVCIHGSLHTLIVIILIYSFLMWDKRFNSCIYLRREILRLSILILSLMIGTLIGHTILVIIRRTEMEGQSASECVPTALGCVSRAAAWLPAVYGVLILLWSGFVYVQKMALRNLKLAVKSPLPVSRNEEMERTRTLKSQHIWILTTVAAVLWTLAFPSWLSYWVEGLNCVQATAITSLYIVSVKWRSVVVSIPVMMLSCCMGVVLFGLGWHWYETDGIRLGILVLVACLQVLAAIVAALHHGAYAPMELKDAKSSPYHFFTHNKHHSLPPEANEVDVFMAAVEAAGKETSPSMNSTQA